MEFGRAALRFIQAVIRVINAAIFLNIGFRCDCPVYASISQVSFVARLIEQAVTWGTIVLCISEREGGFGIHRIPLTICRHSLCPKSGSIVRFFWISIIIVVKLLQADACGFSLGRQGERQKDGTNEFTWAGQFFLHQKNLEIDFKYSSLFSVDESKYFKFELSSSAKIIIDLIVSLPNITLFQNLLQTLKFVLSGTTFEGSWPRRCSISHTEPTHTFLSGGFYNVPSSTTLRRSYKSFWLFTCSEYCQETEKKGFLSQLRFSDFSVAETVYLYIKFYCLLTQVWGCLLSHRYGQNRCFVLFDSWGRYFNMETVW